jgi:integrase
MTMRILRTVLNFAANNYEAADGQPIIILNPVRRLSQNRSWHRERRRRVVIPDSKQGEFYRALMSLRQVYIRDYLLLVALTGLRRTEAATLRWCDIDFEARTITIQAKYCKNRQEHCIPLTDFVATLLGQRKQRSLGHNEYVFPGRRGGHMVEPGSGIKAIRKKIGCHFVTHDLRRGYISMAAKIGVPHAIIKKTRKPCLVERRYRRICRHSSRAPARANGCNQQQILDALWMHDRRLEAR